MHESTGKSPEEIAALLESDVRTVIGWIKRAGSK
jgi:DNA-directed RNA polymerase specialized sigma24 family protein